MLIYFKNNTHIHICVYIHIHTTTVVIFRRQIHLITEFIMNRIYSYMSMSCYCQITYSLSVTKSTLQMNPIKLHTRKLFKINLN